MAPANAPWVLPLLRLDLAWKKSSHHRRLRNMRKADHLSNVRTIKTANLSIDQDLNASKLARAKNEELHEINSVECALN
jgi:hypothetical protein